MSRLSDEKWDMIKDSIDKKNIAKSSRNRRSHCGKGGSVKFPSDYLTKKELNAMNGEVKSYRLNEPMTYEEFKQCPNDIKVMYIKALREKYHVPNNILAEAMKADYLSLCRLLKSLGLGVGRGSSGASKHWNKTSYATLFMEWWYGPDNAVEHTNLITDICEEIKDETPEPNIVNSKVKVCTPDAGHLSFDCIADDALDMVKTILTGKHVHMVITWDTEED